MRGITLRRGSQASMHVSRQCVYVFVCVCVRKHVSRQGKHSSRLTCATSCIRSLACQTCNARGRMRSIRALTRHTSCMPCPSSTLNPQPSSFNSLPSTLNPQPSTLNLLHALSCGASCSRPPLSLVVLASLKRKLLTRYQETHTTPTANSLTL